MWIKKALLCVMAMLILWSTAFAQDLTDEEIERRALMMKNEIVGDPNSKGSLNMVKPFQPIQMNAASLKEKDSSFYEAIGIEAELIEEITQRSGHTMRLEDNDGHLITLVFKCYNNEQCFVFETDDQGVEYLIDVVYGSYADNYAADLVELAGGRYLLINVHGHGTGTMRNWTAWYNLETRRVEMYTLREAYPGNEC